MRDPASAEDVRWRVLSPPAEFEKAVREARGMAIRAILLASVLVYAVCVTFFDWLNQLNGRNVPPRFRLVLTGVIALWPTMFLLTWRLAVRAHKRSLTHNADKYGALFIAKSKGVWRNSELIAVWRCFLAYRVTDSPSEGTSQVQLVKCNGLHKKVPLPANPESRARSLAAFARYLPAYDESVHGSIDDEAEVPSWVPWSLTALAAAALIILYLAMPALTLVIASSNGELRGSKVLWANFVLPAIVPCGWYLVVRRRFNALQRDRLFGFLIPSILMLWAGFSAVILALTLRQTVE